METKQNILSFVQNYNGYQSSYIERSCV